MNICYKAIFNDFSSKQHAVLVCERSQDCVPLAYPSEAGISKSEMQCSRPITVSNYIVIK